MNSTTLNRNEQEQLAEFNDIFTFLAPFQGLINLFLLITLLNLHLNCVMKVDLQYLVQTSCLLIVPNSLKYF